MGEAVTGLERPRPRSSRSRTTWSAAPRKELGRRAAIGALATAVNRDLREPALGDDLPAQAYVGGVDGYLFLDGKRDWVVNGRHRGAATSPAAPSAITRLQNASQRYFGRPDATHVELDPAATSLGGWTGSVNLNRNAGCPSGQRGPLGE